jgi:hypothetical protein
MSADGVPIQEIARLAERNQTSTTELVYRYGLRLVITTGAEVMDRILSGGSARIRLGQLSIRRICGQRGCGGLGAGLVLLSRHASGMCLLLAIRVA